MLAFALEKEKLFNYSSLILSEFCKWPLAFLVKFAVCLSCTSAPGEFLSCMAMVKNTRNVNLIPCTNIRNNRSSDPKKKVPQ